MVVVEPVARDENFYSLPLNASAGSAELASRIALIDQLLSATTNPAAVAALQQAKAQLNR